MNRTDLSLEVSERYNLKVMRIYDTSHYYVDQSTEDYFIEILPVNKSVWLTFPVQRGFSLVLNSSSLHYKKAKTQGDLIDLPDGIYEIKQSTKPNILTVEHYYHFRVLELQGKLAKERMKLMNDECKLSRDEYKDNRDKLRDIEEYILSAKWMVEQCGEKEKGKELYEFAKKLLEQYTNECQC